MDTLNNYKHLRVYCPYNAWDISPKVLIHLENVTFVKPKYLEYNTDTSAQLLRNKDEDIVRTADII